MERVQIQLTEVQLRFLRRRSEETGVSVAAQLRGEVERLMEREGRFERMERLLAVAGAFRSGRSDISENHDLYLDPEYEG